MTHAEQFQVSPGLLGTKTLYPSPLLSLASFSTLSLTLSIYLLLSQILKYILSFLPLGFSETYPIDLSLPHSIPFCCSFSFIILLINHFVSYPLSYSHTIISLLTILLSLAVLPHYTRNTV